MILCVHISAISSIFIVNFQKKCCHPTNTMAKLHLAQEVYPDFLIGGSFCYPHIKLLVEKKSNENILTHDTFDDENVLTHDTFDDENVLTHDTFDGENVLTHDTFHDENVLTHDTFHDENVL